MIFDLDGTLIDSEPNYYQASRRLLARYGVTDFSWEQYARFIGIATHESLETLRREYRLPASLEELLTGKHELYLALAARSTRVFPQMRRLAQRLGAADCPIAVASGSSKDAIRASLSAGGLESLFPVTVSAEEVERGKPAPDVFLETARRLSVEPARCVVLEDSPPGATGAHRAGMRCIAVPSLPGTPQTAEFTTAGLIFPEGQSEFDADTAYEWILGDG